VIVIILIRFKINVIIILFLFSACNLADDELRELRGHNVSMDNIAHAYPMLKPERYCKDCHGVSLEGGNEAEPSRYSCHGQYWDLADGSLSKAPSDHLYEFGGYRHNQGYDDPEDNCSNSSCHGSSLEGSGPDGTPSCYLCHEQKW